MKGSNDNRDSTVHFSGNQTVPASRTRNIIIGGARSSIRLEEAFWEALEEILTREGFTLNDIVTKISDRLPAGGNLSGAVRVFIHSYFYAIGQNRRPKPPTGAAWKTPDLRDPDSLQDPE